MWTTLNSTELSEIKQKFHEDGKFIFVGNYVKVVNHEKYNPYNGIKNDKARERELELIPQEILENLDTLSIPYRYPIDTSINHKSEIINHKSEIKKKDLEKNETNSYKEIMNHYNEVFDRNTTSYRAWKENADIWLKEYTLDQIKQAISNWKYAKGWLGSLDDKSLTMLFRTKNKSGACDYIDELLNQKTKVKSSIDPLARLSEQHLKGGRGF